MEKETYVVGQRADKLCAKCNEERGHIVASVTKRGQHFAGELFEVWHSQFLQA